MAVFKFKLPKDFKMPKRKLPNLPHPMQPIYRDENGTPRFMENQIVAFLCEWARTRGMSLNEIAMMEFRDEDREQFSQLIGYSVSGFGELHYSSEEAIRKVDEIAESLLKPAPPAANQ